MKTYKTMECREAAKLKPEFEWVDDDYGWALVEFEDGAPTRIVGTDGGEPEDQLLIRDWKWVEEELNRAAEEYEALLSFSARTAQKLVERNARLESTLGLYGQHHEACLDHQGKECICGLAKALVECGTVEPPKPRKEVP